MRSAAPGANPRNDPAVRASQPASEGTFAPWADTQTLSDSIPEPAPGYGTSSHPTEHWIAPDLPLDLQSTIDLTIRARAGDLNALEALCVRCLRTLNRYAAGRLPSGVRGMIDTQDVVQEAVQRGLARLDEFDTRHHGALMAYMRKILKNLIIDHLRSNGRRPSQVALDDRQADDTRSPLEEMLEREQIELYETALERLKWRDAELIRLRIDEQLTYDEIATALGLPSGNAGRVAVKRAVLRLAHEMSNLSRDRKQRGGAPRGGP
jgi:RNA polymerase sigma-70 factor (ECF subfamily)